MTGGSVSIGSVTGGSVSGGAVVSGIVGSVVGAIVSFVGSVAIVATVSNVGSVHIGSSAELPMDIHRNIGIRSNTASLLLISSLLCKIFVGALLQTEVRVGHFHSEYEVPHERLGKKKENCVLENSSKYNRGRIGDIISVQITEGRN